MNSDLIDPNIGGRELREGLYDMVSYAKTTDVPAVVNFFSHKESTDGPGVTNMEKPNELPAGQAMTVYSMKLAILNAAAADLAAIRKNYRLRLYVAGKPVLSGKTEKFPFGGVATSEAGEAAAQIFWINSEELKIVIQTGVNFRVALEAAAKYTLTDANKGVDFLVELDGIHIVPQN